MKRPRFIFLCLMPIFMLLFAAACSSQNAASMAAGPLSAGTTPTAATAIPTPISSPTPTASPKLQDYSESMMIGGLKRIYLIHLAPSYTGQQLVPLLLAFHGSGATGKDLARQSHLNDVADAENFVVVYPDGYQEQWADGRGTTPPEQAGVDDVAFVSALIDKLANELNIDTQRVYVTGMSNGGIFAQRLACELADKIAAVASVAGTIAQNTALHCQPTRPTPMMLFMGTDDPSVPFDGGEVDGDQGINLSAVKTTELWMTNNGCSTTPLVTQVPSAINDGSSVLRTQYSACKNDADVILYTIEGGVHTWPGEGTSAQNSDTQASLDASEVIINFFQEH